MSSVTPQRSVEDKDGTPPQKRGGEGVRGEGGGNKGISICTFVSINGEFQIGAGSSEAAEDSLWLRDKMKTICCCVTEKLTRRRQVTGTSRTRRFLSPPSPLSLVGVFSSFGRNPTIRFTSVAQALDLFPRQDNNEKKKNHW